MKQQWIATAVFPKNMKLTDVTEEHMQWAVDRLNHRPRKVLGFKTPHEVFFGMTVSNTKHPSKVAFRI